jgi:hypothetical protein
MKYNVGDILKLKYKDTHIYDRNGNVEAHEMGEYFIIFSEIYEDDMLEGDFAILSQKTKSLTEWYNHNIDYSFEKV